MEISSTRKLCCWKMNKNSDRMEREYEPSVRKGVIQGGRLQDITCIFNYLNLIKCALAHSLLEIVIIVISIFLIVIGWVLVLVIFVLSNQPDFRAFCQPAWPRALQFAHGRPLGRHPAIMQKRNSSCARVGSRPCGTRECTTSIM